MKEALLYRKEGDRVICTACARRCRLKDGQTGFCGVRKNIDGKLYLLVYGKTVAVNVDPIEKKPVTHFMPGSSIFSIGTTGCSWACKYCQNYDISQRREVAGEKLEPQDIVDLAIKNDCQGIAYTYNEPSIYIEYAYDTGIIAHRNGLFNIFVSNGFYTEDTVELVKKFLDAITIDIKGNGSLNFLQKNVLINDNKPIFDTLIALKESNIHLEITDLVVPQIGDDLEEARKLSKFIHDKIGPDTPLHFLRFFPDYKLNYLPPTPVETLEKHYKVAKDEGLNYVYIGNVPGHPLENTYCPNCGRAVIERFGFDIVGWHLNEKNECEYCGYKINIIGPKPSMVPKNRFHPVEI